MEAANVEQAAVQTEGFLSVQLHCRGGEAVHFEALLDAAGQITERLGVLGNIQRNAVFIQGRPQAPHVAHEVRTVRSGAEETERPRAQCREHWRRRRCFGLGAVVICARTASAPTAERTPMIAARSKHLVSDIDRSPAPRRSRPKATYADRMTQILRTGQKSARAATGCPPVPRVSRCGGRNVRGAALLARIHSTTEEYPFCSDITVS